MTADDGDQNLASTQATRCCIVGAGPAGAMLALLLARADVPVTLLESHHDFDRDFRGDTVHPSTLEVLDQIGLADRMLALPHGKVRALRMHTPSSTITMADLSRLRTKFPFIMMLPQVRFLEELVAEAKRLPSFQIVMGANVQRLVEENGTVKGVCYRDGDNRWHEVRADLTVAADGRFSKIRHLAGIEPEKTAPPMDVVWFRLPRQSGDPSESAEIYLAGGHMAVVLDRTDQWQIGYVILKGSFTAARAAGLPALQKSLAELVPFFADRVHLLDDWKNMAVLNVESSRVPQWHRPGLLLIGDAAHVMSPVAGVGINVAIQDAVETANLLAAKLRQGPVTEADVAAVQKRRAFAVRVVQRIQRVIQERIAAPGLDEKHTFRLPWFVRFLTSMPCLRNIIPGMLAFGPRRVRITEPACLTPR